MDATAYTWLQLIIEVLPGLILHGYLAKILEQSWLGSCHEIRVAMERFYVSKHVSKKNSIKE